MTRLIRTPRGPLIRTLSVVSSDPAVRITGFDCITISIHGVTPCPRVPAVVPFREMLVSCDLEESGCSPLYCCYTLRALYNQYRKTTSLRIATTMFYSVAVVL